MQQFPVVYAMTQGGPYGTTEVMGTYIYKIAFEGRMFSYGSAMAIVMAAIILVVSIFGNRMIKGDPIEY
jgi:ABC-type sugar transport system permease subunit